GPASAADDDGGAAPAARQPAAARPLGFAAQCPVAAGGSAPEARAAPRGPIGALSLAGCRSPPRDHRVDLASAISVGRSGRARARAGCRAGDVLRDGAPLLVAGHPARAPAPAGAPPRL